MANHPYIQLPQIQLPKGGSIPNKSLLLKRMDIIIEDLTVIASRRANPPWIPRGGEMGYRCWRDYYISNRVSMPYPGGLLAQPGWFEHDLAGFNDLESWCYLKHEQVTIMRAIQIPIPEDDRIWLKDD